MAFESNDEENIENPMDEIQEIEQKINDTKPKNDEIIESKKEKSEGKPIDQQPEEEKKDEIKMPENQEKNVENDVSNEPQAKLKKDPKKRRFSICNFYNTDCGIDFFYHFCVVEFGKRNNC